MKLLFGINKVLRVLKKDLGYWSIRQLCDISGMSQVQLEDVLGEFIDDGVVQRFVWGENHLLYKLVVK